MDIIIKVMQLNDAEGVQKLSLQLGYSLSVHETEFMINEVTHTNGNIAYVAMASDKMVGWIHAFKALRIESKPFIEIGGMVVDDESRKLGIGKQLVNEVYQWAKQQDCEDLRVRCNTKRSEAHRFYNALGFIESKEQKVFTKEVK